MSRMSGDRNQTLPLNDSGANQMVYGWGRQPGGYTHSDSTLRKRNEFNIPGQGNQYQQPGKRMIPSMFGRNVDPGLGYANPLNQLNPETGVGPYQMQDSNLNGNFGLRSGVQNQQNVGNSQMNRQSVGLESNNAFVLNKFGNQNVMASNIEIQKRVHFVEPLQVEGSGVEAGMEQARNQEAYTSWVAPNVGGKLNDTTISAGQDFEILNQTRFGDSQIRNGGGGQHRASILKSSVYPQPSVIPTAYAPYRYSPTQPIQNRSEAHQFLSSALPPKFKMQADAPLQMPLRMAQVIELARREGRPRKRRDLGEIGMMIYLLQNKMLIWEYRTGRYGEKDFSEVIREIRLLKLAGKQVYLMVEYQNGKADVLRLRPENHNGPKRSNSSIDKVADLKDQGSEKQMDESQVVRIEITEKPIIKLGSSEDPMARSEGANINMEQAGSNIPNLNAQTELPNSLRIEKVRRGLRSLQICFARWIPEMNGLFFINSAKQVSTAVWDEEHAQLRIRHQTGGDSAGGPCLPARFKGLKRVKKKIVAMCGTKRYYCHRVKVTDGLLYLLKTTFTVDFKNPDPTPEGLRLHDIFDNPLYLLDLPSFASAFYSRKTTPFCPNQSQSDETRTPKHPKIRIVGQKLLNYAIREDGQLIPRGKLNLGKVFKINMATLNCHFASSGGFAFSNRIVDFKIESESKSQLLERALAKCDPKQKLDLTEAVGHLRDVVERATNSSVFEEAKLVSRHVVLLMQNGVEIQIEPFEGLVTKLEILSLQRDSPVGKSVFLGYMSEGEILFSRGDQIYMVTKNSVQLLSPSSTFSAGPTANHHPLPSTPNHRIRQIQDLRSYSTSSQIYDLRHNYSSLSNKFSFIKTRLLSSDASPVQAKFQKSLFPRLAGQSHFLLAETKGRLRPMRILKAPDYLASLLWLMALEIEVGGDVSRYMEALAKQIAVWGLKHTVKALLYLFSIEEMSKAEVKVQYQWLLELARTLGSRIPQTRISHRKSSRFGDIKNEKATPHSVRKRSMSKSQMMGDDFEQVKNGAFDSENDEEWAFGEESLRFEDLPAESIAALELTDSRFFRLKRMVLCMLKVLGGLKVSESALITKTLLQSRIASEAVTNYQVRDEPESKMRNQMRGLSSGNRDIVNGDLHNLNNTLRNRGTDTISFKNHPSALGFGVLETTLLEIFGFELERICQKPLLTSESRPYKSMAPLLNRDSKKIRKSAFSNFWSILRFGRGNQRPGMVIRKELATKRALADFDMDIFEDWHGGRYGPGLGGNFNHNQSFWDPHLPAKGNFLENYGNQADRGNPNFRTRKDDPNDLSLIDDKEPEESEILETKLQRFILSKFQDDFSRNQRSCSKYRPRRHRMRLNVGLLELKKVLERSTFLDSFISKLKSEWVKTPFSGLGTEIIRNINKYGEPRLSDLVYRFLETFPMENNLTGLKRVKVVSTLFLNLLIIDNISPKYLERGLGQGATLMMTQQKGLSESFLNEGMDSVWKGVCVELSGKFFFDKPGILRFFFKDEVASLLEEIEGLRIKLKEEARDLAVQRAYEEKNKRDVEKGRRGNGGVRRGIVGRHHMQNGRVHRDEDMAVSSDDEPGDGFREKLIDYSQQRQTLIKSHKPGLQGVKVEHYIAETKNKNQIQDPMLRVNQNSRITTKIRGRAQNGFDNSSRSRLGQELASVYTKIRNLISFLEVAHINSLMGLFTCRGLISDALLFVQLMCAKFADLSEETRLTKMTADKQIAELQSELRKLGRIAAKKRGTSARSRVTGSRTLRYGEKGPNVQESGVPRKSTSDPSSISAQQFPLQNRLQAVEQTRDQNMQRIASQQKMIKLFFVSFLITSERFRRFQEITKRGKLEASTWQRILGFAKGLANQLLSGSAKDERRISYKSDSFEGFLGSLGSRALKRLYQETLQVLLGQDDESLRLFALETALTLDQSKRLAVVEESLREDDLVQLLNKNPRMEGRVGVQNMLFLIHFFSKKQRYALAVDLVLRVCRGDYLPVRQREAAQADPTMLLQMLASLLLDSTMSNSEHQLDQNPEQDNKSQTESNNRPLNENQEDNQMGQGKTDHHSLHETELLATEESLNLDSYITLEKKLALLSRTSLLLGSLGRPDERRILSRRLKEQTSLLKLQQTIQTEVKDTLRKLQSVRKLPACFAPDSKFLSPTIRVFKCLVAQLEHGLLRLPVIIEKVIRPFRLFNGLDSYLKRFVVPEGFFEENYFGNLFEAARHYSQSGSFQSCFKLKNFVGLRGVIAIDLGPDDRPRARMVDGSLRAKAEREGPRDPTDPNSSVHPNPIDALEYSQKTLQMLESINLAGYNPTCNPLPANTRNSILSDNGSTPADSQRIEAIAALAKCNLIFPYNIYPLVLNALTHFVYLTPTAFKDLIRHSTNSNGTQGPDATTSTFGNQNRNSRRQDAIIQAQLKTQKLSLISWIESASSMNSFVDLLMRRRTCEKLFKMGISEVESLWFSDHLIKNENTPGEGYIVFDLYFRLWENSHTALGHLHNTQEEQGDGQQSHNQSQRSDRQRDPHQRRSERNSRQDGGQLRINRSRLSQSHRDMNSPSDGLRGLSSDQIAAKHHSTTRLFVTCLQLTLNLMNTQDRNFELFVLSIDPKQKSELADFLMMFEQRICKLERVFIGMDSRQSQSCLLSFANDQYLMLGVGLKRRLATYLKSRKRAKLRDFRQKQRLTGPN